MKHIFYIHSFITYIVSISIISELYINEVDVLFLCGRNFNYYPSSKITIISLPPRISELLSVPTYGERFLALKRAKNIIEFDKLISYFVKNELFVAYLPNTKNFLMQLMATHPKCKNMVFIEEGLLTYTGDFFKKTHEYFSKNFCGKVMRLIKYPNHINRSFYYRPYTFGFPIKIFVLNKYENSPPEFEVNVISKIISPSIDPSYKLNGSHILILQPTVEQGDTLLENYLKVISILIEYLKKNGVVNLYVKFHPEQSIESEITSTIKNSGIFNKIIPGNISVEIILLNSENLYLYGFYSSLLYYASCWGHHAYSLNKLLEELSKQSNVL